ncbi:hypothetical protein J8F10_17760 [Gemmata sp. G18]|uniref:Uncharacterized protein n=1 Tax=Gemmata palustris TaxID=2822762 RepID=A0ABS5BTR2_9BACT|nr:hypothetical protein [Gemmata palustris]MBP3957114.1 hypothetical protein [Gemmata palustris]
MARLIVTLLLIPGVLLTQLATAPHVHTGSHQESTQHSQPHFHFHLRLFGSADAPRERIAAGSGCGPECSALASAAFLPDGDSPWDHDADAVYVEATAATPERAKQGGSDGHHDAAPVALLHSLDFNASVATRLTRRDCRPRFATNCPLYLRYLALTI